MSKEKFDEHAFGKARIRAKGTRGPTRHHLTSFKHITQAPKEVTDEITRIMNEITEDDLGTDKYQISNSYDLKGSFNATGGYRQVLLQRNTIPGADINEETNYNDWRTDTDISIIKNFLEEKFGTVYRARISVMPPGHELFWHIDTDTSVLCRMQIAVDAENSSFQFRNRIEGERHLEMKNGNVYFVNTGWSHRVVNEKEWRIVLIFGIEYKDIPNKEELHLLEEK